MASSKLMEFIIIFLYIVKLTAVNSNWRRIRMWVRGIELRSWMIYKWNWQFKLIFKLYVYLCARKESQVISCNAMTVHYSLVTCTLLRPMTISGCCFYMFLSLVMLIIGNMLSYFVLKLIHYFISGNQSSAKCKLLFILWITFVVQVNH